MDDITQQPNITISSLGDLAVPQTGSNAQIFEPSLPATPPVVQALPAVPAADNLLPDPEKVSYADAKIQEIDVSKISPNPFQPRKVFEAVALRELANSIKEHGVIQPLVVTLTPVGYELVVGERRFRAAQLAGLEKVPAIIKEAMVDQTKLEVALIENIQRQELNPIEEAQAYERLMKTFNLTQDQVAKKVGKSRPAVANTVRLLNLPAEIQRAVIEGKLMEGHARALLGLNDPEKMLLMYKVVIDQNLNVRQVEGKVRDLMAKRQMDSAAPDPKLLAMESELRGKLGTQVKIQRQGQGGKIMIEFFSDEELSEIINKMSTEASSTDGGYLVV
jgi:ParB family chromosome partitioning protein